MFCGDVGCNGRFLNSGLGPRGWLLDPDSSGSDLFSSASILGGRLGTPLLNTQGKLVHSYSFLHFGFATEIARLVLSRIADVWSRLELKASPGMRWVDALVAVPARKCGCLFPEKNFPQKLLKEKVSQIILCGCPLNWKCTPFWTSFFRGTLKHEDSS